MGKAGSEAPQRLMIESTDHDELSEYFSRRVSTVTFSAAAGTDKLAASATVASVDQIVAIQAEIPTGARLNQGEDLDGYFLQLPTAGEARWLRGGQEVNFGPAVGFIGRLRRGEILECSAGWSQSALRLSSAQMTRCLSQLLDRPIVNPLEFAPTFDMAAKSAKALSLQVQLAATPLDGEAFFSSSPLAAAQFSECVATFVLENFSHNYSEALLRRGTDLTPKRVKRAMDFMRANIERPMTLEEISAAASTSVRALHYSFKQFLGLPPFEYLRQIRLEAAYKELATAPESVTIADIARKWGFPNAGRFAFHCKQSYGHAPSTIRRSRSSEPV